MGKVHACTRDKFVMSLRGDHLYLIAQNCPDIEFFKPGFKRIRETTFNELHIAIKDVHAPLHAMMAPGATRSDINMAASLLSTVLYWLDTLEEEIATYPGKDFTLFLLPIEMVNNEDEEEEDERPRLRKRP